MQDHPEKGESATGSAEHFVERRREERFDIPDVYQHYITLHVKSGETFVPAILANFSRSGILFEGPVPFEALSRTECKIAVSLLLSREISFHIQVRYCYQNKLSYIVGAAIDTIADNIWFDVFVEIHDFIVLRKDNTYKNMPDLT